MRGFVTDYLKDIEGEEDWVCVLDFHGRHTELQDMINITPLFPLLGSPLQGISRSR